MGDSGEYCRAHEGLMGSPPTSNLPQSSPTTGLGWLPCCALVQGSSAQARSHIGKQQQCEDRHRLPWLYASHLWCSHMVPGEQNCAFQSLAVKAAEAESDSLELCCW